MGKAEHRSFKAYIAIILSIFMGVGCFALCMHVPVSAEENTDDEPRTVRVAFPIQKGMSEITEDGYYSGYTYEYVELLAQYAGWNVEYITYSSDSSDDNIMDAINDVMSGDADIIGPIISDANTQTLFEMPAQSYGTVYTVLCASESGSVTSENIKQIPTLRVAVYKNAATRNEETEDYLKSEGINYELIEFDSEEEQVTAVQDNKADVMVSVSLTVPEGTKTILRYALRPYYLACTKGNTELVNEINEAILKMDKTRPYLINDLQEKYFGNTPIIEQTSTISQEDRKSLGTIDVLCATDDAPYAYQNDDGLPSGVLVSLINDYASYIHADVSYSFAEDMSDIKSISGDVSYDIVIGRYFNSEYCVQNGLITTEPIMTTELAMFRTTASSDDYSEANAVTLRNLQYTVPEDAFKSLTYVNNLQECVETVVNGDADIGIANRASLNYYMYENNISLILTAVIGNEQSINIAVSSNAPSSFLSSLNSYIRNLSDAQISDYANEANQHTVKNPLKLFFMNEPLAAWVLVLLILLLTITLILLSRAVHRLRNKNRELADANKTKSEFLSRMSHDMRTPMNGILGAAELSHNETDVNALKKNISEIEGSGKYLLALINDTLDVNRLDSSHMTLHTEPVNMKAFAENIETMCKYSTQEKDITFTVSCSCESAEVIIADKMRLQQIMMNLLSNSIKFTPAGGRVSCSIDLISVHDNTAMYRFIVDDTGVGMSKEFLQHIYEPFSQEKNDVVSQYAGTGLGMSIVKALLDLMNGSIHIDSKKHEGTHTTIMLEFPISADDTENEIPVSADPDLNDVHVLLCEDHPLNAEISMRLLQKKGCTADWAHDGKEGVDMFSASSPGTYQAILMDIRMPVMDGIEASKKIRSMIRSDAGSIPIIAMTANALDEDIQACTKAGMNAHLSKPVDPHELYQTIRRCIDSNEQQN